MLTAEHKVLDQKHDAATVWVENAGKDGFTACSREMQNFDGLHEKITLVSLLKLRCHKNLYLLLASCVHFSLQVAAREKILKNCL